MILFVILELITDDILSNYWVADNFGSIATIFWWLEVYFVILGTIALGEKQLVF